MKRFFCMLLASALLLSCAACGGAKAASMWLVKTEGSVAVTDGEGTAVALTGRLGLFSGYGVSTQAASYGWIDLDETKLTKMDENSDVEVQKDGKNLVLTVNSGSLFFNVTQPLAADETLEIRSSDMVTAIRGTCGWVEVPDARHMNVYILEGTVECSVGGVTKSVPAGQRAALSAADSTVTVEVFSAADIPAFVSVELREDEFLAAVIRVVTGMDVTANWTLENGVLTIFGPVWEVPWDGRQEEIRSAVIQDGVTEIGPGWFTGYTNLTQVQISDSVTSIESDTFAGCSSLTELTLPDSITYIGEQAFADSGLTELVFPAGLTSIEENTCFGCTALTRVVIPDGVTSIGEQAFVDCNGLTELVIPGSVRTIGAVAFHSCMGLTDLVLQDGVTTIERGAFGSCFNLSRVSIPDSVTSIGESAFSYTSLTAEDIPARFDPVAVGVVRPE